MKNDGQNRITTNNHRRGWRGAEPGERAAEQRTPDPPPGEIPIWRPEHACPARGDEPNGPESPPEPGVREIPERPSHLPPHSPDRRDRERAEDEGMMAPGEATNPKLTV
jgi:hypothetical protein